MGQSLVKNNIHIVFSTKHRAPSINPPYEQELHSYLASACKNLECQPIKIGGHTSISRLICKTTYDFAMQDLPALKEFGLTTQIMARFAILLAQYELALPAPRLERNKKKSATANIKDGIKEH